MSDERWIVVRNWDRFQHYRDRNPPWVKNYTRLMSDHNYLSLSLRQRGILHGLWLLYAAAGRELGGSPVELGRMLGDESVRRRDLERLEQAGFIEVVASKPLASRARSRETEKVKGKVKDTQSLKSVGYDFRRTPSRASENDADERLIHSAQERESWSSETSG